jgi:uncharacterized membrane protein YfcA
MPEALAGALTLPGLPLVVAAALAAGLVYGFAGFGGALVFMPVAARVLGPQLAVAALALMALSSWFTILPAAWRACDRRAAVAMILTALPAIGLGVVVLGLGDPVALRWAILALCAATLAALLTGWRRRAQDGWGARLAVAVGAGFSGGATGLNGPVLVLFHLSGQGSAVATRANTAVFLTVTGFAVLPAMAVQGLIDTRSLVLGVLLALPYAAGSLIGRALFVPDRDRTYRRVAHAVILGAILAGLPIWDGRA